MYYNILFYHVTLKIALHVMTLKLFITLHRGYLSARLSIPYSYSLTYIAPDCLAFETAAPNNLFRQRIRPGQRSFAILASVSARASQ